MATISGQNEQDERAQAIAQLKSRQAAKQAELARIDEALAAAEDHDFHARLGREQIKTLDVRQKSEIVSRLGSQKFLELIGAR
jgi:hypothetical protein